MRVIPCRTAQNARNPDLKFHPQHPHTHSFFHSTTSTTQRQNGWRKDRQDVSQHHLYSRWTEKTEQSVRSLETPVGFLTRLAPDGYTRFSVIVLLLSDRNVWLLRMYDQGLETGVMPCSAFSDSHRLLAEIEKISSAVSSEGWQGD